MMGKDLGEPTVGLPQDSWNRLTKEQNSEVSPALLLCLPKNTAFLPSPAPGDLSVTFPQGLQIRISSPLLEEAFP